MFWWAAVSKATTFSCISHGAFLNYSNYIFVTAIPLAVEGTSWKITLCFFNHNLYIIIKSFYHIFTYFPAFFDVYGLPVPPVKAAIGFPRPRTCGLRSGGRALCRHRFLRVSDDRAPWRLGRGSAVPVASLGGSPGDPGERRADLRGRHPDSCGEVSGKGWKR